MQALDAPEDGRAQLVLAFAAIYVLWGATYLAIRYAVEAIPPFLMIGTRSVVAGVLLAAILPGGDLRRCSRRHWCSAAVSGALLFLGCHGLLSRAEQSADSGVAALVLATIPAWMAIFWFATSGRTPGPRVVTGLLLGFAGVAVLCVPAGTARAGRDLLTMATLMVSAACWAAGSILARHALFPVRASTAAAMQLICGGLLALAVGGLTGEAARFDASAVDLRSLLSLVYLIVFGSIVSFGAYTWLLRRASPEAVGSYAFVNPVIAVLLGWLVAGEPLDQHTALAGPLIVAGVVLLHRGPHLAGASYRTVNISHDRRSSDA